MKANDVSAGRLVGFQVRGNVRQKPPGLVRSPLPSLGPAAPKGPVVKYSHFHWAWGRACWPRNLRAPQSCPRLRGCQSPKSQQCDFGASSAPPQRIQPEYQQHAPPRRKRAPTRAAAKPITHTRSLARSCGFVCFFPESVALERFEETTTFTRLRGHTIRMATDNVEKNHHAHAAQGPYDVHGP